MKTATLEHTDDTDARLGDIIAASPHTIGAGFTAHHFSEEAFGGRMDPLLMVDDFVMTAPTFDPHLHAGISAVTAMFEDSTGSFLNRDTLGHNVALRPGDLYWLAAASGAAHEERPEQGARTHALQIFVNLPCRLKKEPARALHIRAEEVPVIAGQGHRVRVLLGRSGTVIGAEGTPEEITMLDGFLDGGRFSHLLPAGRQAWIYAVSGQLLVRCESAQRALDPATATTVEAGPETEIVLHADAPSHFVLLAAKPIREPFVKHGPLVMSTEADVRRTLAYYAEGKFGRIPA
ncbi:pirin family protein [Bradyrhizobium tropiciagri]|uniref:pirin family protein n=1 Tax=Bradyrhizobium tropiciagri TaxID=312253 RepID=UPI001BABD624|nr:pirin-like C-terminal cupin domain-containing protein [Bradyrhizobium tropiciagri]MBR0872921.1 pirin family protein [Bradyrhizobium tropiciagri]